MNNYISKSALRKVFTIIGEDNKTTHKPTRKFLLPVIHFLHLHKGTTIL